MSLSKAKTKARGEAKANILVFIGATDRQTVSLEEFTAVPRQGRGRSPILTADRYRGQFHTKEAVARAIKALQNEGVLGKGGFPPPIPKDIAFVKEYPILSRGGGGVLVRDFPSDRSWIR